MIKFELGDHRLTIRDITVQVVTPFGSPQALLKDHLGLRPIFFPVVRRTLNLFQKQQTRGHPEILSQGDFFQKYIITGDEIKIYAFDTEADQQLSEWRLKDEARLIILL